LKPTSMAVFLSTKIFGLVGPAEVGYLVTNFLDRPGGDARIRAVYVQNA
jgi:hypothetical protein